MENKNPIKNNTPKFNPADYESKWQKKWVEEGTYKTPKSPKKDNKQYILGMFPYPSGDGLHTGHSRVFTGTDVLARFHRMNGKDVLHPMGWDSFGLPAENAAIKKKKNPMDLVPKNIENFKRQITALGISCDWNNEIATTDPEYYAITQKLFILFYKCGLLYKKDTPVFFCPSCVTGLAQEEVLGDGTHERCGNKVEKRELSQWIFRITKYADSLLKGLDDLDWPKGILEMQRNWIGKKEGVNITYEVEPAEVEFADKDEKWETITCFTTRPDTNFGATFVVLAPEHNLVKKIINKDIRLFDEIQYQSILEYVTTSLQKTERERLSEGKEKTGVFTGLYVINELNGERLPIWISDFVIAHFGTGALVGVPGHDKKDFEFATAVGLPVKRVVVGPGDELGEIETIEEVYEGFGKTINSDFLNGLGSARATEEITKHLKEKKRGEKTIGYHLRDWIFSRQRYWGEPIPMVYCEKCAKKKVSFWNSKIGKESGLRLGKDLEKNKFNDFKNEIEDKMVGWFPISEAELPLELPKVKSYEPTDSGKSPLSRMDDWKSAKCPECGGIAVRETDTMPNWAGSCWYFLAYPIAENIYGHNGANKTASSEGIREVFKGPTSAWLPVDCYIGGADHAVLHLLYARFWMHVLQDLGSVKVREPFTQFRKIGMLLADDGKKMSKSRGNVVNPDEVIKEYGADALRVYLMFMAPFNQEVVWSVQPLRGAYRFLRRIWQTYNDTAKITDEPPSDSNTLSAELQDLISQITREVPDVKYNTPIAGMMKFLNEWERRGAMLSTDDAKSFLKLLAPYAPYITEEIWHSVFKEKGSIHNENWPQITGKMREVECAVLPVQVNGKHRDNITVNIQDSESVIVTRALESDKVAKHIGDSEYKTIYVKGKILNFVLKN